MNLSRRRALILAGAMASTAAVSVVARPPRPDAATVPSLRLDSLFPQRFGDWREDPLSHAFVRVDVGQAKPYQGLYDQTLERTFVDSRGRRVMLSVAYGQEQTSNLQLHRPEVCYRYSGYEIADITPGTLRLDGRPVAATRLFATLPGRPEPVTYWTLLGGAVVADLSAWRRRRISAALRRQLLDGLLVRVSTIDPEPARAHELHARFADELVLAIAPADRYKVIGAPTEG